MSDAKVFTMKGFSALCDTSKYASPSRCTSRLSLANVRGHHLSIFIFYTSIAYSKYVVVAGVKLKILKANHNLGLKLLCLCLVVVAGVKLKILKANHNTQVEPIPNFMLLLLV